MMTRVSFVKDLDSLTLFSDNHTLNLSMLMLNFQCVGVAKEGYIKTVPGLIPSVLYGKGANYNL